jgi:hypothetical protein
MVKDADMRLVELGGYARFGMDDGYMIGPPELVFRVLAEFAVEIKEDCGCELNVSKCKLYSNEEGACEAARRAGYISEELLHLREGVHDTESGDLPSGLTIFNVPVGVERFVAVKSRDKAMQVNKTTEAYVRDLGDTYSHELWTMLHFSLQHRITYWLRTCTLEETTKMAGHVDYNIMEAVHAATGVDFDTEVVAKERLRLPARMKGRGIKRATDTMHPSFLGR